MTQFLISIALFTPIVALILFSSPVQPNNNITTAIVEINKAITPLSPFVPLGTIFAIVGFIFVFEGGYQAYKLIRWVYQKIAGIN